jgi:hypothetical protein
LSFFQLRKKRTCKNPECFIRLFNAGPLTQKTHKFGETNARRKQDLIPPEIAANCRTVEIVAIRAYGSRKEHEPEDGQAFEQHGIFEQVPAIMKLSYNKEISK